ncbi:ABC transporter D family member 1 [Ananas comosus]|uniref:ABC transporter D family member 1 n=1 Tax=Ananas comosus TaxID=4615 RepID=A0A199W0P5_ANACO|nr:ABC transporter D family member 1 [Ananas comosus]
MRSLQLLQLTEHGRSLLASRRRTVALVSGALLAGGTLAYMQSRHHKRSSRPNSSNDVSAPGINEDSLNQNGVDSKPIRAARRKKSGLRSLHVLAAILLKQIGPMGMRCLLSLVTTVVLRTALSNRLAKVQGFLFRAAFLRRAPAFVRLIAENLLLCFLQSTLFSTSKYLTGALGLRFKNILTDLVHTNYFENMAYYKISHVDGQITNPEQRIASDIPKFCTELSELIQDDLTAVSDGIVYTWRLCSYASPKYVLWILAYVIGAGAAIRNFSPSFGKLMSKEQQLDGDYRQLHSRLRTHAESVAFYGGENREASHIKQQFKTLIHHLNLVLHEHWWFGMIQDFLLKYLGATVGVVLIIEPFFAGNLRPDSSTIGRAEMLSNIRYHTSVIISLFQSLGTLSISSRRLNRLSGYADRIHELLVVSRELSAVHDKSSLQKSSIKNYISEANYIEFAGVKVVTPTGNVLVDDLSLRVDSGSNLLITGPNGSGKSSLFRVLGGLWPLVSGHIVKPGVGSDLNKEIFYVPQRPYTAVGTLRDQLIYPLTADQETEPLTYDGMVELLKNVDLEYLLDRYPLEKEINWGDELSLGEQQRLGMARLFYHKPKFAILDECTSAVTTDMEERFCSKVRAMGTSCITISHRPALVAFHDIVLSLDGEGGWSVQYKREGSAFPTEEEPNSLKSSETDRKSDALAVQRAFITSAKGNALSKSKEHSYSTEVIASSPKMEHEISLPHVPQLQCSPRPLPLRAAAMFKILIPRLLDKQGAQLLAVALLVFSRTWISDRIASLNGTSVKYVLEQDKAAFIRLTGISVLQSAANSIVAPSLSGYADRIHELLVVSRELSAVHDKSSLQKSSVKNYISEANYIEFAGVKVVTPTGNVLVDDLSPNGSGKSSLFRVLGGLWPLVSGHIVKPGVGSDLNKEIFYVPQRPYTAVGTLRDQLIYPLTADQETEPLTYDGMVELLKNVDLEYLLDRYPLEKEINWGDELSLGEQQRLGMARLFYHKPKFAILDECTSAVTTDMEERFCSKVRAMGTSCITISHRPALVAFHDIVLSLDGEGGWSVQYKREGSAFPTEEEPNSLKSSETDRKSDALAVQRAFITSAKGNALSKSKEHSYSTEVIASSPKMEHEISLPHVPQLQCSPRPLPLRAAAMFKILIPRLLDKQGAQLLAVALLVFSRTWISDRIASLNGTSVKYVLEQDKAAFIRLTGISVLQSAANSIVAPSLRHLTAKLALGWRIRLTHHLLKYYLKRNAFYKVFHMSGKNIDADQRLTHDVDKLTNDLAGLVTGMVKPSVDILWFTWRMKLLTGRRGVAILYAYMLLGLGFLRTVAPEFGDLASQEQELEGTFRFMHARLRTHAESVAFFGGGSREKAMIEAKFRKLLEHSKLLLRKKWLYGILDDFVTKQLPHNVTWGLSLLYALEHQGDRALSSTQGELAHALRFLASVVSQSFLAFGDILELHKKYLELSGGINRVFELEELLHAAQSEVTLLDSPVPSKENGTPAEDRISFQEVDIVTPSQKLLARRLVCDIVHGKSLLVTGPNGSGKSSIFRVLRDLWPIVSGRLVKPSEGVFHVPQRPYTSLGTLRDQIIYPLSRDEAEQRMLTLFNAGDKSKAASLLDAHLKTILENVRLVYLLEREGWDATPNWEDVLSLGEQQRLGMARLFFHHPKFGILDECTNATSVDVEEHLYRLANEMGITVITSSQRPALIPFHSLELKLIDGEGKWELCLINQ